MRDQNVYIVFDGIYNRSTVYVNGEKVKFHPYGYSPLCIEVTEYLNGVGDENIIAVSVDHERYAEQQVVYRIWNIQKSFYVHFTESTYSGLGDIFYNTICHS